MIWESGPWRDELMKVAERLERRRAQRRWTERTMFLVERDIMVSAYAVRKLTEALKLSTTFQRQQVELLSYPLKGHPPDQQNWHDIDRFYDLAKEERSTLVPADLCNQIIHSRIVVLVLTEDRSGLEGLLISSDWTSRERLYYLEIGSLIRLLRQAGEEDVVSVSMVRDEKGDWKVTEALAGPLPFR